MAEVHHPVFARLYARMAALAEPEGVAEHRTELLAGLSGRVIEVGAGTGLNFGHYPSGVTEVLAVEPEAHMRVIAARAAAGARIPIRVVDGTAEQLPADDAAFDAAVTSLVLCSVADQGRAFAEIQRVLRTGGELRFYEHVRSSDPRSARLQDRVDWIWSHLLGGCHPNRDTESAIAGSGFRVEASRRFDFQLGALSAPAAPHVIGRAVRG
jgi:ubiquinone/menaquinone biosynthesis C-methylase UbiE